jgi:esterase/lipase superfamily enzyme
MASADSSSLPRYQLPRPEDVNKHLDAFLSRSVSSSPGESDAEAKTFSSAVEILNPLSAGMNGTDTFTAADRLRPIFEVICRTLVVPPLDVDTLSTMFFVFNDGLEMAPKALEWKLVFGMAAVTFNQAIAVSSKNRWYVFSPLGYVSTTAVRPAGTDHLIFEGVDYPSDVVAETGDESVAVAAVTAGHLPVHTEDLAEVLSKPQRAMKALVHTSSRSSRSADLPLMTFTEGDTEDQIRACAKTFAANVFRARHESALAEPFTVFVHGYNNSNDDAIQRAVHLAENIKSPVTPFLWPSANSWYAYRRDQATAQSAGQYLYDFITEMSSPSLSSTLKQTPPPLHIIAHSMGNYATALALQAFRNTPPPLDIMIISAAADVDTTLIAGVAATFPRWTSYYNPNDWVLKASSIINLSNNRSGLTSVDNVQCIRVAEPSTSHAYVDDDHVQQDIAAALHNEPLDARPHIRVDGSALVLHNF